jgi:recyclin-1
MDSFISHVLEAFRQDAGLAVQVFPSVARVVVTYAERLANDVVSLDSCYS